eukprot:11738184-Alexandrium_andersonii.AAC.1
MGRRPLRPGRRFRGLPPPSNCCPLDAADSWPVAGDGAGGHGADSRRRAAGPPGAEPDGSSPSGGRSPSASW